MFKFLTIFTIAVVAIKAYDFSDLDYNQYLFDEFDLLNQDVALFRQRRDAIDAAGDKKRRGGGQRGGGQRVDRKKNFACCKGDKLDPEYAKQMMEHKRMCAIKLRANNSDVENFDPFDCEKMGSIKQLILCEDECFAHAINILDESGKLNRETIVKRFADHMVGDIEWKKASYEGYIDKCLAQVETKLEQADQTCSSAPTEFHHCIWSEFINGCPAELRVESHKCNKLRERHARGSKQFFNQHLIQRFLHRAYKYKEHDEQEQEI